MKIKAKGMRAHTDYWTPSNLGDCSNKRIRFVKEVMIKTVVAVDSNGRRCFIDPDAFVLTEEVEP